MARKKKGDKIDGWLVIDKPLGMSSSAVVGKVKWLLKAQKAGHAGTLDPLASGILPIGLGEATKTMPFIVDASKTYEFTMQWGKSTTTDDSEGEFVATSDVLPTKDQIDAILHAFTGAIEQTPPIYSAIKVDGKRSYDLARQGVDVELKSRIVNIQSLSIVSHDENTAQTTLKVDCGKGTYIRSLARDIALKLGSVAYVIYLRRTRVGPFDENNAISLEKLEDLSHSAPAVDYIGSLMTALDDIPVLAISETEAALIKQGRTLTHPTAKQGVLILLHGDIPIAIAEASDDIIRSLRVFNM